MISKELTLIYVKTVKSHGCAEVVYMQLVSNLIG